jgi:3-deoxy-D-manno-octulosonic-acid transferase
MRFLYSLLIILITPLVLLYFSFRGFRDRAYLQRWSERFAYIKGQPKNGGILIHAASVGEFNAASPLIKALLKAYPNLQITVTTLTPTGSERVKHELGKRVFHTYIPIDLPFSVARFLDRIRPSVIIVMETEIWPNLYLQAQAMDIPLLIANARLSEHSVKRFNHLSGFVGDVLQSVSWFGAQSRDDAGRLARCGANEDHIEMTGNLKFDLNIAASLDEKTLALRARWNTNRPVVVAGSTHEADENVLIPAFVELLKSLPDALLILVPRYPERFERAEQLAREAGLSTSLRSDSEVCDSQTQCFVIDAIGELMVYYACADVTYVGGSIGDQGGHNALEPAALGKPVLFGPNMVNAREIANQLLQCRAAREIKDQQGFKEAAESILTDGSLRDAMGQAGKALIEQNKGALDLTLNAVEKQLSKTSSR